MLGPPSPARRWLVAVFVGVLTAAAARASDDVTVPLAVQARLLAKAASYDRNLSTRAGGTARVWILVKAGSTLSEQTGEQMLRALGAEPLVGGLPHQETLIGSHGVTQLVERIVSERPAILYVSAGFSPQEVTQLADALGETPILTVACAAGDVAAGLSLGFDLVSGRPRLQVQLKRARKQGVDFDADFLALAQVFQ